WLMLQQEKADDFVVATGETHTVREFLEVAFGYVGKNYQDFVDIDPVYYRPAEVDLLIGDASKARQILHWQPKTTFRELVELMVEADISLLEQTHKINIRKK
ncbi:MAG TPA: GDP-mannose 4,6-dehydratase, partial [bacterium]|nr:GDP-mannose 4,6-dehydratase [bacterium]